MKSKDKTRITAAETKSMRRVAKLSWMNYTKNEHILKDSKTYPSMGKISKYKTNWIKYTNIKPMNRLPKLLKNDKPQGLRNRERAQ
jgi:hypothetical protein